jgi:two-component system, chemotaxis family, CheB/CheR fusion protein
MVGKGDRSPGNFRVVALCGSAGAVSAFIQILQTVPDSTGMAFVILTHRRARSRLAAILSRVTNMPVEEIKSGCFLVANRVYTIPPGSDLTTDGTTFQLGPVSTVHGWPDRFDLFLSSLAKNTRGRAVAIILSGMATDGSAALGEIRLGGGLTFAQSDAEVRSMPTNAVATGNVDYFCTAADIGTIVSALPVVPPA